MPCATPQTAPQTRVSNKTCAQARHFFLEAHALQNKPAALLSAANMALKLREASTAKREYEQASAHAPHHKLRTSYYSSIALCPQHLLLPLDSKPRVARNSHSLTTPTTTHRLTPALPRCLPPLA